MKLANILLSGGTVFVLSTVVPAQYTPSFSSFGTVTGNHSLYVTNISGDGSTIIGTQQEGSDSHEVAYRYTAAGGFQEYANPTGLNSSFNDLSYDGSVAVGSMSVGSNFQAIRWTAATGFVTLGTIPGGGVSSYASTVSADGSIIYGADNIPSKSFVWDSAHGMQAIATTYAPTQFSKDGAFGSGRTFSNIGYRWNSATNAVQNITPLGQYVYQIGPNLYSQYYSVPYNISHDGQTIVGACTTSQGTQAFMWTPSGGTVGLGDLAGTGHNSSARNISDDGKVIVGQSGGTAFIWDSFNGMRDLKQLLISKGLGTQLAGWTLLEASAVYVDQYGVPTVTGNAIDPNNNYRGFVATVPEPTTVAFVALASLGLIKRRKGSAK